MSGLTAFERNAYATSLETRVIGTGTAEDGRPFALLEDTILYPEGGGQPSDFGTLNGVAVLEVVKRAGQIRHLLAAPVAEGPADLRLDWARRFDHMQQHTGQHLLTALAQDRFGWPTTAFHLGESVSDIEVAAPRIAAEDLERLEEFVAAEIRAARPLRTRRVSPEAYREEKVRSRGLPDGHQGDIRLVEIEGLDLNTCGGTHLRSTAELEGLKLLGTESIRGGTRIFYAAGGRLRRRMAAHEARNATFRTLLGAPDEDLPAALETRLEQLKSAERRARHLEEAYAGTLAESLAGRPERLVDFHGENLDAAFLGRVGRTFAALSDRQMAFLTAERDGAAFFVLAARAESGLDLTGAGRAVAALLEGRGGGNFPVFQGKAGSLKARAECLKTLAELLGGAS